MTNDLESRIAKEIAKTGFPLELRVAESLNALGYLVDHSVYFVDQDEGKGREVDIVAHTWVKRKKKKRSWYISHFLIVECKKSDKPWVVFTSPKSGEDDNIFHYDDYYLEKELKLPVWPAEEIMKVVDPMLQLSPLYNHPRLGRSCFVPFKPEASEVIFKAITTSVKAALSIRENPGWGGSRLSFFYPTIVLQGRLFEAFLESDKIVLAEVDTIPFAFTYQSARYKPVGFKVPIVTEDALGRYVYMQRQVLNYWVNTLEEAIILPQP